MHLKRHLWSQAEDFTARKREIMSKKYIHRIALAAALSSAALGNLVWGSAPAHAVDYVRLVSVESNRCLNVEGASFDNGVQVIQWDCVDTPNNHWRFENVEGHPDYFRVRAGNSDKCLNVEGGSLMNGARVIQWPCSNSNNENWRAVNYVDSNKFMLQAEHSGKCLNVEGASHENGARLIQWDCADTNNNRWTQQSWNP